MWHAVGNGVPPRWHVSESMHALLHTCLQARSAGGERVRPSRRHPSLHDGHRLDVEGANTCTHSSPDVRARSVHMTETPAPTGLKHLHLLIQGIGGLSDSHRFSLLRYVWVQIECVLSDQVL